MFAAALLAATLHVHAAASLTDALREIASAYTRATGVVIELNLAGSGTLARQIERGAPGDVFLSADEARVDALERAGLVASRRSILSNALAIVGVPLDSARRIAIARPDSVPAGIYAKRALMRAGLWERIAPRVIPTQNVRAALAAVEAGNADAAVVYRTDARLAKRARVVAILEAPEISYSAAVLRESPDRRRAAHFVDYLSTPPARAVFVRYGFIVK